MKQLLHISLFLLLFAPAFVQSQDSAFTVKGILQQPSAITSFTIFYPRMHMDSMRIQTDGSFSFSGNISEAGEVQIGIRETSVKIWVEPGLTQVYLSEKPDRNGRLRLTVDSISGSEDTYLYYYTFLPKVRKPVEFKPAKPISFDSEEKIAAFSDSLSKVRKKFTDSLIRANAYDEIDSVYNIRPNSNVLPWLIRHWSSVLGNENIQFFYYRLTAKQQESKSGKDLLKEMNKLQLLNPGNVFDDFIIKNEQGKKFQFSSLKSKYVLIDFWASWCGPCRVKHPYLRDVYLKNKQAGLEIISISLDEEKQKWLEAIQKDKLTWINVSDLNGRNSPIAIKYKISGIPFSVLLDENRKVILVNPSSHELNSFFKDQASK